MAHRLEEACTMLLRIAFRRRTSGIRTPCSPRDTASQPPRRDKVASNPRKLLRFFHCLTRASMLERVRRVVSSSAKLADHLATEGLFALTGMTPVQGPVRVRQISVPTTGVASTKDAFTLISMSSSRISCNTCCSAIRVRAIYAILSFGHCKKAELLVRGGFLKVSMKLELSSCLQRDFCC